MFEFSTLWNVLHVQFEYIILVHNYGISRPILQNMESYQIWSSSI